MSIAEELHKTIDELSEEQQQELLETARQLLDGEPEPEEDNPEFETSAELDQELVRRYQHLREHPDQIVSARESNHRARARYGLQTIHYLPDNISRAGTGQCNQLVR